MISLQLPHTDVLRDALNDALRGSGAPPRCSALRIDRARVRPGERLVIGATAHCHSGAHSFQQPLGIRLLASGSAQNRFLTAHRQSRQPSRCGPAVLHLPALSAVAWLLPNDCKIAAAHVLLHSGAFAAHVAPHLLIIGGTHLPKQTWTTSLLRYVPEQSCTAYIASDDHSSAAVKRRFIGKCASDNRGAWGIAALRHLQLRGAGHTCPVPLLYLPTHSLSLQQYIPGVAANTVDYLEPDSQTLAAALQALASVHRTGPAANLPFRAWSAQPQQLFSVMKSFADAPYVRPAQALATACLQEPPPARPITLVHGDLHPANLLHDKGAARLIDFDGAFNGPAEIDLAGFIAALVVRALYEKKLATTAEQIAGAVLDRYAQSGGVPLCDAALYWQLGFSLLQHLCRNLSRHRSDYLEFQPALLSLAERAFAQT